MGKGKDTKTPQKPEVTGRIEVLIKNLGYEDWQGLYKRLPVVQGQGMSRTNLLNVFDPAKYQTPPVALLVALTMGIKELNARWLLTGEGEMLMANLDSPMSNSKQMKGALDTLEAQQRTINNALQIIRDQIAQLQQIEEEEAARRGERPGESVPKAPKK